MDAGFSLDFTKIRNPGEESWLLGYCISGCHDVACRC
ncbi:hypothetical protein M758_3G261100 [Ceratodon purpureus]|uniref:Uncharacterized protein n=1 Tax=Ceratodon purpureus TaxID=3225 RepID=A0A8T0IRV4_CERPU|nr:hypothetical protein KC19_3G260400 [Ceratodon purpureus]KAG0624614.1 hypothetical protein M758_3G261100 [Ceratodon purpureus]